MLDRLLERFHSHILWLRAERGRQQVSAETIDVCAARLFTIALLVAVVLSANLIVVHAGPQSAAGRTQVAPAERVLFDAANRERVAQGLAALRWDEALANAAREHAQLMAERNALSHQFGGEAALQDRARVAGARFTEVAENVAEGPSAEAIHVGWMNSPHHRANLLDPELTAIGIAVVGGGPRGADPSGARSAGNGAGMLFAVQDFSQSVASLSFAEQERVLGGVLAARGLQVANFNGGAVNRDGANGTNGGALNSVQPIASRTTGNGTSAEPVEASAVSSRGVNVINAPEDARKTCEMERGWAGGRPGLVVRYETGDLSRLPGELEQKLQTGRYRVAAVGACEAGSSRGFTRFRVAVVLY
jgi:uncharacterized protein YkwD